MGVLTSDSNNRRQPSTTYATKTTKEQYIRVKVYFTNAMARRTATYDTTHFYVKYAAVTNVYNHNR